MTNRVDLSRPPGNEETLGRQESSPRNLMIIHVTDTTATLHWTPPLSDVRLSVSTIYIELILNYASIIFIGVPMHSHQKQFTGRQLNCCHTDMQSQKP